MAIEPAAPLTATRMGLVHLAARPLLSCKSGSGCGGLAGQRPDGSFKATQRARRGRQHSALLNAAQPQPHDAPPAGSAPRGRYARRGAREVQLARKRREVTQPFCSGHTHRACIVLDLPHRGLLRRSRLGRHSGAHSHRRTVRATRRAGGQRESAAGGAAAARAACVAACRASGRGADVRSAAQEAARRARAGRAVQTRTSSSEPAGAGQLKRLHDGALLALLTTPNALSRP